MRRPRSVAAGRRSREAQAQAQETGTGAPH